MAELSVGILGLGRLGTSFGLALMAYNDDPSSKNHFTVTGYDTRPDVRDAARRLGAANAFKGGAAAAAEGQDIVILTVPYAETRRTLRDIAPVLREGAVVLDIGPLKLPTMAIAEELLPTGAHMVGATAVINPALLWDGLDDVHHGRADLFEDGDFLLAPAASADADAIELVRQLAELVGARTHFVDPAEHDGIAAATEGIPAVLGIAAFRAMAGTRGWAEAQRLTNPNFGRLTHHLLDTHPDDLRDHLHDNREAIVHQLDGVMSVLAEFREALAADDRDAIEAAIVGAEQKYRGWFGRRVSGRWDPTASDEPDTSVMSSLLSGMLGGFIADKIQGRDGENNRN